MCEANGFQAICKLFSILTACKEFLVFFVIDLEDALFILVNSSSDLTDGRSNTSFDEKLNDRTGSNDPLTNYCMHLCQHCMVLRSGLSYL